MNPENNQEKENILLAELKDKVNKVFTSPEGLDKMDAIAEFIKDLRQTHQDLEDYALFHILVGSTTNPDHKLKFDLPGGEMEKFIRDL